MNRKLLLSHCWVVFVLLMVGCNQPPASAPAASTGGAAQPAQDPNAPVPPRVLKVVHAQFPSNLWDKAGSVAVSAVVGVDGKVGETKIVSSPHPELNQFATDAVKQWQFDPARKAGKPVPYTVTVNVNFAPPAAEKPAGTPGANPAQAPAAKPKP